MCHLDRVPRQEYEGRGENRLVAARTKKTRQWDERPSGRSRGWNPVLGWSGRSDYSVCVIMTIGAGVISQNDNPCFMVKSTISG